MSCKRKKNRDNAVTELVGEMLMLTIVLILMAVFAATASSYLPPAREPSVTVKQENILAGPNSYTVYLYHKGGDAIPLSELRLTVDGKPASFSLHAPDNPGYPIDDPDRLFDLSEWIEVVDVPAGSTVRLSTQRAVIYPGVPVA
jgi:FlaG/FlaF family flagellin (archaellin)